MTRSVWPRFALSTAAALLAVLPLELIARRKEATAYYTTTYVDSLPGYTFDTVLGYHPRVGTTPRQYTRDGCINAYETTGALAQVRTLFIGDSVTARGFIQDALRNDGPDWLRFARNAGVEGYDFWQIAAYFRRHAAETRPAHVVYFMHNNDLFNYCPVVRFDEMQCTVFATLGATNLAILPGLRHSAIYRLLVVRGWKARRNAASCCDAFGRDFPAFVEELRRRGISLSVVLLPIHRPLDQWTESERASRACSLSVLRAARVPVVDLFAECGGAATGTVAGTETPGDTWHPDQKLAQRYATIVAKHLLHPTPGPQSPITTDATADHGLPDQRPTSQPLPGAAQNRP